MAGQLPILEITQEFFTSPMWKHTIKDFVLANCFIFTGEDDFLHAHFQCHKKFCSVIENTLNIYLLDIIGIHFATFHEACLHAAANAPPGSIAREVIGILKQATDFRYFAAKMYAYNVMLDREAASSFLLQGETSRAFFVTDPVARQEVEIAQQASVIATSQVNALEQELGLPPSSLESLEAVITVGKGTELPSQPDPAPPKPADAPKPPAEPPKPAPELPKSPAESAKPAAPPPAPAKPPKLQAAATGGRVISDQEVAAMRRKIQQERAAMGASIDPAEIERRRGAFLQVKDQIVAQRRRECREEIDLGLRRRERPEVQPEEDPMEALRRALAGRVRTMIDDEA
jgi:hypothetical protein